MLRTLCPCTIPGDHATKVKILTDGFCCEATSYGSGSYFTSDLRAARDGGLIMHSFSRALVTVLLPTPLRTRDTDKKK